MSMIRHICAGHEYRYDTETGEVRNNYGTVRAVLVFHKLTPAATPFVFSLYADRTPRYATDKPLATLKLRENPTDADLAVFAIGQTAAHLPEA